MTTLYKFKAYYTDAGVGTVQDPAPTCTVINMADDSKLADAQATTASTNMPGLYSYEYSGNDGLDCVAWFKTTDTGCDVKELASYVSEKITTNLNADVAGVETKLDTVDSNVDAILADTGTDGVVLKAAGLNADAVTKIQANLALEATLTAIKGAGWTNINSLKGIYDGYGLVFDIVNDLSDGERLDALLDSIITHLTQIKGAGWTDETLVTIQATIAAIDALIDAIKLKTDALDVSSVTVVTAVNGSTITILRGDTFSGALTDIGALTDYVSIDFTVKEAYSKTDNEATIRIRKNASGTDDGLMRLNGAAALSSALGSIAIDDLASGDITITLDETATDDLSTGTYVYDIQMISAAGVKTLTYGKLIVSADVTRLVA